jgi:hypothetical protein
MKRFPHYCLLSASVLTSLFLAMSLGQRLGHRTVDSPPSLDGWSIPELVDYLNRAGLAIRLRSSYKNGALGHTAFLTTTDKTWDELNDLRRFPNRIHEWRGTVFCEQRRGNSEPLFEQGSDHYLVAGSFAFFGDAELLERIGDILIPRGG